LIIIAAQPIALIFGDWKAQVYHRGIKLGIFGIRLFLGNAIKVAVTSIWAKAYMGCHFIQTQRLSRLVACSGINITIKFFLNTLLAYPTSWDKIQSTQLY
ncbi:hypothetical protein ACJX0J_011535, partial [Zea mays]